MTSCVGEKLDHTWIQLLDNIIQLTLSVVPQSFTFHNKVDESDISHNCITYSLTTSIIENKGILVINVIIIIIIDT